MSSIAISSSAVSASSVSGASRAVNSGWFARIGLGTVVAAVVANVLVYFVGDAVVGYDPEFVVLANVSGTILFTLVAAIGAVLVYGALLRYAGNPARTFSVISAVVFVVTLIPDFTYIPSQAGATNGQTATLVAMHVVAAAVIVWMLTTFARPQER
jgi:hypothetical protein